MINYDPESLSAWMGVCGYGTQGSYFITRSAMVRWTNTIDFIISFYYMQQYKCNTEGIKWGSADSIHFQWDSFCYPNLPGI